MIILGIDPGYAILGYGAVEAERGKIRVIDYGVVETTPKMTFPERLERLYAGTKLLLERYRPDHVAFEELFSIAIQQRHCRLRRQGALQ